MFGRNSIEFKRLIMGKLEEKLESLKARLKGRLWTVNCDVFIKILA